MDSPKPFLTSTLPWIAPVLPTALPLVATPAIRLKLDDTSRLLVTMTGKPLVWSGVTAWEPLHRLSRKEADTCLDKPARNGFSGVRAVAIARLDGREGTQRWMGRRGLSRISHGVAPICQQDGRAGVMSKTAHVLRALDAATVGRVSSSEVIPEGKVPPAAIGEGMAFTAGGGGGKDAVKAFKPGGRENHPDSNLVLEPRRAMPEVPSITLPLGDGNGASLLHDLARTPSARGTPSSIQ